MLQAARTSRWALKDSPETGKGVNQGESMRESQIIRDGNESGKSISLD